MTDAEEIDESELKKKWGDAVFKRRKELGLSQDALAAEVGIAQQNISAIEKGASAGTRLTQHRIAKALGVKHVDLFHDPRIPEETAS